MLDPEKSTLTHIEIKNSLVTIILAYASRVLTLFVQRICSFPSKNTVCLPLGSDVIAAHTNAQRSSQSSAQCSCSCFDKAEARDSCTFSSPVKQVASCGRTVRPEGYNAAATTSSVRRDEPSEVMNNPPGKSMAV